jgi:hypothetical protein
MTLLLTLFLACGEKEETDTSPATEQVEETQPASEETSEPSSEDPQDTGSSETTEDATFKTNEQLGVCEDEGENS